MITRIERVFWIGAAVVLILFLGIGSVIYQSTKKWIEINRLLGHTEDVLVRLGNLQNTLTETQVSLRLFITSGEERNLEPLDAAKHQVPESLRQVQALTLDDPAQRVYLRQIEPMLSGLFDRWDAAVSARRREGAEAADRLMTLQVLPAMRDNRETIAAMIDEQNQLLGSRSRQAEANASRAIVVELFLGLAVAGLLVVTYLLIRSDLDEKAAALRARQESEERLRLLLESTAEAIHGIDMNGRCTFCNPAMLRMLGYDKPENLIGKEVHTLIHHTKPDGSPYPAEECRAHRALREGKGIHVEDEILWRADGTSFPVEYWSYPIKDGNQVIGAVVTLLDISERRKAEVSLRQVHDQLNAALLDSRSRALENAELSRLGDLFQACETVEEACKISANTMPRLFGGRPGALCVTSASRNIIETFAIWNNCCSTELVFGPADCWALRRGKMHVVTNPDDTVACAHVDRSSKAQYVCVPLAAQGETLGVLYVERTEQDAASDAVATAPGHGQIERLAAAAGERISLALGNLKLREILKNQSIRDPVTGLYNRRYMEESLARELHRATRKKRSVALVMLDLDHFKAFNDSFGHPAGDLVLREIATILKSRVRGGDIACRYGGEEFALILSETDAEGASLCFDQIRHEIRSLQLHYRGQALGMVTVSAGVAVFPHNGQDADELVRAGDMALYRAKTEGRDRVLMS